MGPPPKKISAPNRCVLSVLWRPSVRLHGVYTVCRFSPFKSFVEPAGPLQLAVPDEADRSAF